jgi:tetratricopeptide (TPR) repeat protein
MDIKQFKEVKSVDRNRETFIEILKAENEEFMKRNILKSKIIKSLKIAACIFLTFGLCIMGIILIPKYAYNNEKLFEKFYSPFQYPFVTRSTSKEISIPIVNALSFYIEGDYNNAISELSSVDDSLIFDDAIFIIKGISFIELEKYDLAIEKLKLVDENSLLYSSALWYQGLCNLKINEKKAAKQIFNKLLSIDPCYQKKSKKLLRFL